MNGLMRKLQKIQDECVEKQNLNQPVDENVDEFTRVKRKVAYELGEIRKQIKERDELELSSAASKHTVEANHNIRKKIREIKVEAQNLDALQKKEEAKFRKKNKENPDQEAQIENRTELVGLVFQHIKEVEALNNRKHGESAFMSSGADSKDPTITELPNIDDEGFQMLRANDAKIDALLDMASGNVNTLKEMAHEMGKEAELQGIMMDNLDKKVDDVNEQLENLNTRLLKALENVRKGDRFILDIILLCVLLGIAGYIYKMIK